MFDRGCGIGSDVALQPRSSWRQDAVGSLRRPADAQDGAMHFCHCEDDGADVREHSPSAKKNLRSSVRTSERQV